MACKVKIEVEVRCAKLPHDCSFFVVIDLFACKSKTFLRTTQQFERKIEEKVSTLHHPVGPHGDWLSAKRVMTPACPAAETCFHIGENLLSEAASHHPVRKGYWCPGKKVGLSCCQSETKKAPKAHSEGGNRLMTFCTVQRDKPLLMITYTSISMIVAYYRCCYFPRTRINAFRVLAPEKGFSPPRKNRRSGKIKLKSRRDSMESCRDSMES